MCMIEDNSGPKNIKEDNTVKLAIRTTPCSEEKWSL